MIRLFSFVDVLFISEPPTAVDGGHVAHNHDRRDLFSFVIVSGVEVYVRSCFAGLFRVMEHGVDGASIGYLYKRTMYVLRDVYIPPNTVQADWLVFSGRWDVCDTMFGDFNARYRSWDPAVAEDTSMGNWTRRFIDDRGYKIFVLNSPTFKGISTIDLCLSKTMRPVSVSGSAGLNHDALLLRLLVNEPPNLERLRPAWKRIDHKQLVVDLSALKECDDDALWEKVRSVVDSLPRNSQGSNKCPFWSSYLDCIRRDVSTARKGIFDAPDSRSTYNLVRRVYRAMLLQRHHDYIKRVISNAQNPELFRLVRQLTARRTLPSMDVGDSPFVTDHSGISDLIAPPVLDMGPPIELVMAMKASPTNTGPGLDDIGYPFLRMWYLSDPDTFTRLVQYGLDHDIEDWHSAEVVLIPKANKLRYNIVKSWRMIHLLLTIAKVVERIILLQLSAVVDLEPTQFRSWRRRGFHDALSIVYGFLRHNAGMACVLMSMDIESGFDNIDLDLQVPYGS